MQRAVGTITVVFFLVTMWAFSSGPPDGRTGAPNEGTCAAGGCHSGLNTGGGSLTLNGPESYNPGDTLDFDIQLTQSGQQRWGFELTVLDDNDAGFGEIIVTDASRTQLSTSGGKEYLKQTRTGTDNGTADAAPGWAFRWVAPSDGSSNATFYVAGNAANGNGGNSGDFIYTISKSLSVSTTSVADGTPGLPTEIRLAQNYPNPFNPSTTIQFELERATSVKLTVHDINGRQIATLIDGHQPVGIHKTVWEAGNLAGGTYFAKLQAGTFQQTRRMVLVK